MASDDRFYLLKMVNRDVLYGDIGSLIGVEGLIIGGAGARAEVYLPGRMDTRSSQRIELNLQEWSDLIQRLDDPEILVGPPASAKNPAPLPKVFQRKLRFQVSGDVQQKVWAADGFKCGYCTAPMGQVLMTTDHFIPLELGGSNDVSNYLTACRSCNKRKGSQHPQVFVPKRFEILQQYLMHRKVA